MVARGVVWIKYSMFLVLIHSSVWYNSRYVMKMAVQERGKDSRDWFWYRLLQTDVWRLLKLLASPQRWQHNLQWRGVVNVNFHWPEKSGHIYSSLQKIIDSYMQHTLQTMYRISNVLLHIYADLKHHDLKIFLIFLFISASIFL